MFYEFPVPTALNGEQLKAELGCEAVYVRDDVLVIVGELLIRQALSRGIAAHVPAVPKVLTAAEKLFAATGLTVAEYKALGL